MEGTVMLDQPEKIDAKCPFCHGEQVFMVDIIAALNAPLPTLFAIECKTCGRTGEGHQEQERWHIDWNESSPADPRSSKSGAGDA